MRAGRGRLVVGLIPDTHGLLRPEAVAALSGSDAIVHAGDVGDPAILAALARIAPVVAVRGNVDRDEAFASLPETATLSLDPGTRIHVLHDAKALASDPAAAGFRCVVSGHSHRPEWFRRDGVLHVNPGSAGPRRFRLPITLARLVLDGDALSVELVELVVLETAGPAGRRRR